MDYSSWQVKIFSVNKLRLDPENPRLATSVKRPTQAELIHDLILHEEVLDLAKQIAFQGFFPNELLVATRDGSNVIVVEGNRRLAALKVLLNPELAPPTQQSRVQQFADHWSPKVERIPVLIAPNRDAAVPLIIARHKGDVVKAWTPVMQARFVQSRVDHGLSIDDVAQETGLERSEVVRSLRDAKLYDVIRSLELPAQARAVVEDPRQFPYTTLRRLVEYSSVQQLLGIEVNERHGFVTSLPSEAFQKKLARVVVDVADGTVTSRSHNTSTQVDAYVREIESKFGKSKRSSKKTPASEFVDPSRVQPQRQPRKARLKRKKLPPVGLIPKGFPVDTDSERICSIVEELKGLRVTNFPNACAITLRSLLEMGVSEYLQDVQEYKKYRDDLTKKENKKPNWSPSLNQQLGFILKTPSIPLGPDARKSLQKFVSDTSSSLTLDTLNWFTHNRYVPPTVEQLRAFWLMLTPLFELTLQNTEQNS